MLIKFKNIYRVCKTKTEAMFVGFASGVDMVLADLDIHLYVGPSHSDICAGHPDGSSVEGTYDLRLEY